MLRLYDSSYCDVVIRRFRANKLIINNTMKHNFMNFKSMVWGLALSVALAIGAVSCTPYDDTELNNRLEAIKGDIASLRESVENELASLRDLINGLIVIEEIKDNKDGSVEVILSNDSSFTVYPKGEAIPSGLVTVIENEDGVLCWATYDKGKAKLILVDGKPVPVSSTKPIVRVAEDGLSIEVSFDGGTTWIPGYEESAADRLIGDIEVVYSEWQVDDEGNALPLYCLLTLADGTTVKVGMNSRIILDSDIIYAAAGSKGSVVATAEGAVDFITTAPEGWSCEAELDNATITLTIGAPTSDAISAGKATADGVVKLYVVFDNGLSAISSIAVSTSPIFVSYGMDTITITTGGGVDNLLCGLATASSYDAATIAEEANKVLAGGTSSAVYSVEFGENLSVTLKANEINPNLEYGVEYIFWYVIPYTSEGEEVVSASDISTSPYTSSLIAFECTSASFFDAEVEFAIAGSAGYKIGCVESANYKNSACLKTFDDSSYALREDCNYTGSVLELLGAEAESLEAGVEYTFWYLECGGKSEVTVSDIVKWNFTTKAFVEGGSLELEPAVEDIQRTSFYVQLNSVGHIYAYYAVLTAEEAAAYTTDKALVDMLYADGVRVKTTEAIDIKMEDLEANTEYKVVALAVDANGKIGKLFNKVYKTKNVEYNSLSLNVTVEGSAAINATTLKATSEGAVGFAYMQVSNRSTEWLTAWKRDKALAEEFMVLYGDKSYVHKVGADGVINLRGLDLSTANDISYDYIPDTDDRIEKPTYDEDAATLVFVAALDGEGLMSKVEMLTIYPEEKFGNIVRANDAKWATSKPTIDVVQTNLNGDTYACWWYTTPGKNCTTYSYSDAKASSTKSVEELIAYIVDNCEIDDTFYPTHKFGRRCTYHESESYMRMWCDWVDLNKDSHPTVSEYVPFYEMGLQGSYSLGIGSKEDFYIYTTWVDADGNFYEPLVYDPAAEEFVPLTF
jgi:hypothetical protein